MIKSRLFYAVLFSSKLNAKYVITIGCKNKAYSIQTGMVCRSIHQHL